VSLAPPAEAESAARRRWRTAGRWGTLAAATALAWPWRPEFPASVVLPALSPFVTLCSVLATKALGVLALFAGCLNSWHQPLGDWNALAKKITAAVREVDARPPILVNSIGWAYPQQFDVLRPTADSRTVYEVHFYDPHYYTHQKQGDHVTYPGVRVPGKQDIAWDKATIEARLAPVRAFQRKYHVPVFVGEFGCARYAPGAEQWLRDQMDLYEKTVGPGRTGPFGSGMS
jgi:hypothetical protein